MFLKLKFFEKKIRQEDMCEFFKNLESHEEKVKQDYAPRIDFICINQIGYIMSKTKIRPDCPVFAIE